MLTIESHFRGILMEVHKRYNAQVSFKTLQTVVKGKAEFYTQRGELIALTLTAKSTQIDIRLHNSQRQCVYTDTFKGEPAKIDRLFNAINRYILKN